MRVAEMFICLAANLVLSFAFSASINWKAADVADTANYYQENGDIWKQFVSLVEKKPELLDENYAETASESLSTDNGNVLLRQFTYKEEFWPPEPYPKYMIELVKGPKIARYPLYAPRIIDKQWQMYLKPQPVLILERWTGGNADGQLNYLVLSLADDTLFQLIGYVDEVKTKNDAFTLNRLDNHFEYCMHQGSRPCSPLIMVPYKIQGTKLVLEQELLIPVITKEIEKADQALALLEVGEMENDGSYYINEEAFHFVLLKFKCLVYLEKYEEAWQSIQELVKPIKEGDSIKTKHHSKGITLPEFFQKLEEAYPQAVRH